MESNSNELPYKQLLQEVLSIASEDIRDLKGQTLDVLDISKPLDIGYARHLSKVVSKLSPIVGNMIEYYIIDVLNKRDWTTYNGTWIRQDPGFPDNLFQWDKPIKPGVEVKTWFPLATEITARFKDSEDHFQFNQTNVAIIAWLPEFIIFGKPKIIDVFIDTASGFAFSRNLHYHNPPHYLIFEPEDTTSRTRNLQQTNTNGYVLQGGSDKLESANNFVSNWGESGKTYSSSPEYQNKIHDLLSKYKYRLDTNYAKIDRIGHSGLEEFKQSVLNQVLCGYRINEWGKRLKSANILNNLLEIET